MIPRLRKMCPVCKVLSRMNLVALTKNKSFDFWGNPSVLPTVLSSPSFNYSSLDCASSSSGSYSAGSTSYVAIDEAQNALFDYLHCTRGLINTDAEHISTNSPIFLEHLMSKVEKEKHVGESLVRYLRYHPINEFEPFFESIGLKPSEYFPLLPSKLMFLSDDIRMLELFHVLCDYGVPRNNIGKIYKEAGAIFRFDTEQLRSKLVSFENLGLSKLSVTKLISCCPELLIGGVNNDFFRVWDKLNTLGIDQDWVQAYLDEKKTYLWNRTIGLLDFIGSIGCSDVDLAKLVKTHPRIFFDDSGNQIYVVVALLLKSGLTMSEVLNLLVRYPKVLAGKFAKNLWEAVHFLNTVGMDAEEVGNIVKTHLQVLGSYTLMKPISAALKLKMDIKMICDMIRKDPNALRRLAMTVNTNRALIVNDDTLYMPEKTSFMLKLGFVENSDKMIEALKIYRGRGDRLQERFECLVNAGLDYNVVASLVRRDPCLLSLSRDTLEKKIDYLINSLGQPIEFIIAYPKYLHYNVKRVAIRVTMNNWLKEKGVLRSKLSLKSLLSMPEKDLIRKYVSLHPEGLIEWERLKMLSCRS